MVTTPRAVSAVWSKIRARLTENRLREKIEAAHFKAQSDPAEMRRLFKSSVGQVEIETSTYCNRVCWFCPNSYIDRRSVKNSMDEGLYLSILADLATIDYDGVITYSRYNEPLADKGILTRIRQARKALPNALLSTHTNGDYLTRAYLDDLYDAGMRQLKIQVYLGNDDRFDDERMLERMKQSAKKLDLPYVIWRAIPGRVYEAWLPYRDMRLSLTASNFDELGTDRGGLLDIHPDMVRKSPCAVVFESVYVDWNGAVVPCCNVRSDAPEHQRYIVDHLSETRNIFQAYADSPLVAWRRGLIGWDAKKSPCDTCTYATLPDTPGLRRLSAEAQALK